MKTRFASNASPAIDIAGREPHKSFFKETAMQRMIAGIGIAACFAAATTATAGAAQLRLHYTFDETTGTTAPDVAFGSNGGDNDGTLNNMTFDTRSVAGQFGNAIDLSPSGDDFVAGDTTGPLAAGDGSYSVAFWANDDFFPGRTVVWAGVNTTDVAFSVGTNLNGTGDFGDDRLVIGEFASGGSTTNFGIDANAIDNWTHIAFNVNTTDGISTVWINGVQQSRIATVPNSPGDSGALTLGGRINGGSFDGNVDVASGTARMDDFAIFAGELTQDEVELIRDQGVAAIPEPASIALLGLGGLLIGGRRRKR